MQVVTAGGRRRAGLGGILVYVTIVSLGSAFACPRPRMRRITTRVGVKKQATGRMSADAVEDASDTAESLEGIKVFWIQKTRELIRVEGKRTEVRWRLLRRAGIGQV